MKKVYILNILLLMSASLILAQVNMEIGNGMLVETTGGLSVELSGDLVETGTGYLNGVVTSGDRGANALTQFAGLTITTGGVDQITRTTGTALLPGSPKTSLRNYEVENTTGAASNISSVYLESGSNIETNGIVGPFLYSKVGSAWTGYSDNSTAANTIGAADFNIPSGTSNIAIAEGVGVAAKIFLEGPYAGPAMTATLSLPLLSPYTEDPRTASAIPTGAVDWVLVGLRTGSAASTNVGYRSAFVKNDGTIIDDAGSSVIGLPAVPASYYITVKHRNHLAVMSNGAQSVPWVTP